ncbi:MAG TPA: cytochrome c biogenesis heme-transporting ATPase CcmA [Acidiferrobacteraceae bacterium]|nr:cytochrome c biogenesis heme-transporting ATPase CcmA [Acidiferrobacteraceae bacterium]
MGLEQDISLEAHGLSCIRDDRILFSELEFDLRPHQVLVIEGRNGSGKTSLLRILCGIRMQDEGTIHWCGDPIDKLGGQYFRHLAYIGHMDGVKRDLTAMENLAIAKALGTANDIGPEEALEQVGLGGFEDVFAQSLSAGQRRRIALARLLVTRHRLWIVDEPFTALDKDGVDIFKTMIEKHTASGGMVAFTSHQDVVFEGPELQYIHLST